MMFPLFVPLGSEHKKERKASTTQVIHAPGSLQKKKHFPPATGDCPAGHADGSKWRRICLQMPDPTTTSFLDIGDLPSERRLDSSAFECLWDLHPVELGEVVMMGQRLRTPRWQHAYNLGYFFSGLYHEPER